MLLRSTEEDKERLGNDDGDENERGGREDVEEAEEGADGDVVGEGGKAEEGLGSESSETRTDMSLGG